MPKTLAQKQNQLKDKLRLTDLDRGLTGRLGKVGLFDARWATLGSAQFYDYDNEHQDADRFILMPFSAYVNRETNLKDYHDHFYNSLLTIEEAENYGLLQVKGDVFMLPLIGAAIRLTKKERRGKSFKYAHTYRFGGTVFFGHVKDIHDKKFHDYDKLLIRESDTDTYSSCFDAYRMTSKFPQVAKEYQVFKDDYENLSIYNLLMEQLKQAQKHYYDIFKRSLNDYISNLNNFSHDAAQNDLVTLQNLLVSLDKYKQNKQIDKYSTAIQDAIKKHPNLSEDIHKLLIGNQLLLLMVSVNELKPKDKTHLTKPMPYQDFVSLATKNKHSYTREQLNYITSSSRNIVAMAGAGTGKSTALGGRIDYLKASGVNPNSILVLSFTNAAANNITQRYPGVKSFTIASVINSVYRSFFDQQLTSPDTLINSLRLVDDSVGNYRVRHAIIDALENISKHRFHAVDYATYSYDMLRLLYSHAKEVADELNNVGQTTLELQQQIMYFVLPMVQKLPKALQSIDYILVDEAQDTSLFELVFLVRMANYVDSDLNFIGDANQTLYEFRNANAKSLNIVADAPQVAHYVFDINHRSNNEILTMANQVLKVLSTNQKTEMQLSSASFDQVTLASYEDHVHLEHHGMLPIDLTNSRGTKKAAEMLTHFMKNSASFSQYVDDNYKRGEQTAFLAMSRDEVNAYADFLAAKYGEDKIEILTPLTQPWSDTLSTILVDNDKSDFWDNLPSDPQQASVKIYKRIASLVNKQTRYPMSKWMSDALNLAIGVSLRQSNNKARHTVFNKVLVNGEIRHNAVANTMRRQAQLDLTKPFIISTIHSAKGLEFDHVVLHALDDSRNRSQSALRALGVGLTRAKKDEFLIDSYTGQRRSYGSSDLDIAEHALASGNLSAVEYIKDQQASQAKSSQIN